MRLTDDLASDAVLDRAYVWLCRQRRRWPGAADVWSFRRDWPAEKARLRSELQTGRFRFGLQERVRRQNGEEIDLWSARDALVLKALALVLSEQLPVSRALPPTRQTMTEVRLRGLRGTHMQQDSCYSNRTFSHTTPVLHERKSHPSCWCSRKDHTHRPALYMSRKLEVPPRERRPGYTGRGRIGLEECYSPSSRLLYIDR